MFLESTAIQHLSSYNIAHGTISNLPLYFAKKNQKKTFFFFIHREPQAIGNAYRVPCAF